MDANVLKKIAVYGGIYALGVASGALAVKYIIKAKEESRLEGEWAFHKIKEEDVHEETSTEQEEGAALILMDEKELSKKGDKIVKKTDYTKMVKPRQSIENVARKYLGEKAVLQKEESEQEPYSDLVHVISIEESVAGGASYAGSTLTYYETDDVLVDEDNNIVTNTEELLGDGLHHFGEGSHDPDAVYVRNEKLKKDYEVVRLYKSYASDVLGIAEKKPRTRKVKKTNHVDSVEEEE